ncbi:Transposon Ty3-G Gag-Pol polyprotein [Labeo rohita]|uniref:ribonuclease H n=1 Tax=Labeo rohita TaxID=84645 RepID=A0ABQ8MSP3_LABRO|nr:Transposon Ty3-G Gag-Pol polyprotein [Labeo rohita]
MRDHFLTTDRVFCTVYKTVKSGRPFTDLPTDIDLQHCMNHRLELSVGDAVEEVAGLNHFQSFFDKVYSLYHASAKNHQELSELSLLLQDRNMTLPRADACLSQQVRVLKSRTEMPGLHVQEAQRSVEMKLFKEECDVHYAENDVQELCSVSVSTTASKFRDMREYIDNVKSTGKFLPPKEMKPLLQTTNECLNTTLTGAKPRQGFLLCAVLKVPGGPQKFANGERLLRDPCLKPYTKTTRYWPPTAYDVTAGVTHRCWRVIPVRLHCTKGRRLNTTSSSFVWSTGCSSHVLECVFLPALATSQAGIHTLYAWFAWGSGSLEGADWPHCERLPLRTLRSRKVLFKGAFTSVPRGSALGGSGDCTRGVRNWIWQRVWRRVTPYLLPHPPDPLPVLRDRKPALRTGSTLRISSSEEVDVESVDEVFPRTSVSPVRGAVRSGDSCARRSLPFFPDLHTEVSRLWNSPFSSRLFIPASYNGYVAGMDEHGYRAMPRVEQTLASYLSPESASSLKAPFLPSKPLRVTSALVGKGYTAAGQAGACLHTMSVLQAYQADLLKELDEGDEIKDNDISAVPPPPPSSSRGCWAGAAPAVYQLLAQGNTEAEHRHSHSSPTRASDSARPEGRAAVKEVLDEVVLTEAVPLTLPVLQGPAVSSEHPPQSLPPGNVAELGSSPPPRGSLGSLVQVLPAGELLQDTILAAHTTPETSLERLVPLVDHLAVWKLLPNVSAWVLHTGLVMEQEVATLLRKKAIEVVPPHDRESGFFSQCFIVPKKDGGLRPILDLRLLNRSVKRLKFKMLTIKQEVPKVCFKGEAYQYRVLPFRLSPRTFTKCAALAPLRHQGIRILNYIDDWLILAQSEQVAVQHQDVVLAHMKELGLRLNAKKSVLSPLQRTTYLGVVWDSTTMQACLSPARIESILTAVARVKQGRSLTVKQFQQLLGLMAAASNVIPFGLLYMRPLQWWLKTRGFSPRGNPLRMIKVTRRCLHALDVWRKPWFLSQGPVLGVPCHRVTLVTDPSLTGWGAVMSGHPARGLWSGHQLTWHINCLEILAVFQALKHFLPDLRARHVLVRTDNTTLVSYINHQGGLGSRPLYKLAHQILVWSQDKLLSLRAVFVPGHLNLGADRGMDASPRGGKADLESFWSSPGGSLCYEGECSMSPLVLSSSSSSPGSECHGTDVAKALSVRLCPDCSAPGSSRESAPGRGVPPPSSPVLAGPSRGFHPSPPAGAVEALGVASEGAHLLASSLSTEVVETILQSRAPSTRKLYALKWKLFTSWCGRHQQDPVNCPVGSVLEFLQDRLSAGLTHSTLKVYVAGIVAYHAPLDGLSVGRNPLVTRFLRGALRLRPPVRPQVPSWDLSVVLEALCLLPFELNDEISDRHLTIKMVLFLALSSLKRVGDLQALSVAPCFLDFAPDLSKAFLYPRTGYVPKVPSSAPRPVVLQAFCPPPFWEPDQQKLNCMCPKGLPASKQTLSRWIVDAISISYESSGLPPPLGVKAHSTRRKAASKAFLAGVSMQDICNAAGTWILAAWASRSHSVLMWLEFLKGNISGYVCNPGSPWERDAASRGHAPASLDVTRHWSDYTRDSERCHAEGVPIAFQRAVSFPLGTGVTYVT